MVAKPRILVVDDENAVRASFDRVLSEGGYDVNAVVDGPAALDRVRREPYDLAFVDLRMPGMSGMEVVRSIRSTRPETRIVIVTGYGTEETAREASALGVFECAAKPLGPDDISGLAERALAWTPVAGPAASAPPVVSAAAAAGPEEAVSPGKALVELVRGSLLGLAYVVFLPFVGFAMLGWLLGRKVVLGIRGAKAK